MDFNVLSQAGHEIGIRPKELSIKICPITGIELPVMSYATDGSAGVDIRAYPELDDNKLPFKVIQPGETYWCHTGIRSEFPNTHVALMFNRSGLSTVDKICLCAGVYVIDSDYRGEWRAPLQNNSDQPYIIYSGNRIAQVIFIEVPRVHVNLVDRLSETNRGPGFGSTGQK